MGNPAGEDGGAIPITRSRWPAYRHSRCRLAASISPAARGLAIGKGDKRDDYSNGAAGEIGNGTISDSPSLPAEVTGLTNVTQVSAGSDFSLAVHTVYWIHLRTTTTRTEEQPRR